MAGRMSDLGAVSIAERNYSIESVALQVWDLVIKFELSRIEMAQRREEGQINLGSGAHEMTSS